MLVLADSISIVLAAAGVIVLGVAFTFGASWRAAIPIALELWTGAGLLRLVGEPSWARIVTAAAIILIRRLILSRAVFAPDG
jgi:hypothetical protein